jgi:magnesium-transporting ATPase (P-type)
VKAVVFDKTGTLTVGKPSVVQTKIFSNMTLLEMCDFAAAAEVAFVNCLVILNFLRCVLKPEVTILFY